MASTTTAPQAEQLHSGRFVALSAPGFARLWGAGVVWNLSRWMAVFVASYLVNDLTGSPILVQLVGVCMFAPMFIGGIAAGALSDRFDRKRLNMIALISLIPLALAMGVLILAGALQTWMVYPFMLVVGASQVIDMTVRRALVFDIVGSARVTNALALEGVSLSLGSMLGAVTGGALIAAVSIGGAFLVMAALYILALAMLWGLAVPPRDPVTPAAGQSMLGDLREGLGLLRHDRTLVSILGVTVLMNLVLFPFLPMIPVFADRLEVDAFRAGILGSAAGVGMFLGALVWAARTSTNRGLVYVGGSFFACAFILVFAASPWYWGAVAALVVSGLGMSGFGTMQGVLVMVAASDETRGRALGLTSMAIGALPFGMLTLGAVAQFVGSAAAVIILGAVGLVLLALWVWRWPEAHRLR